MSILVSPASVGDENPRTAKSQKSTSQRKIIRPNDIEFETGNSIRTTWEMVAAGTFPPPIQIGKRNVGWLADEVDAWREQKRRERDERIRNGGRIAPPEYDQKRPPGRPRKDGQPPRQQAANGGHHEIGAVAAE